ncbi:MAG: hypothetical protein AAFQ74_00115 [Cyanobacteria bacterium J06623_4]
MKPFKFGIYTDPLSAVLGRSESQRSVARLSAAAIAALATLQLGTPAAFSNPTAENADESLQIETSEPAADTQAPSASSIFSGASQRGDTERLRQYLQRLRDASEAEAAVAEPAPGIRSDFPSLGSTVFNEQLASYTSYIETVGVPDILIVGSSRALQGIDPEVLQSRLIQQGYDSPRVYNFSVNGATAQVVNFILGELLPGNLPGVIVWGDGSRAFNDGRRDRTWESLVASPGYQAIRRGERPAVVVSPDASAVDAPAPVVNVAAAEQALSRASVSDTIDALGFSAVGDRFDPAIYYRQFPRVSGQYDGAYSPFTLYGEQTTALAQAARFVESQNAQLIFVNLPLSSSYLDDFRLYHEGQFQSFLADQSGVLGFSVVDLLTQWESQPGFFADPSHINQHGAAAIADQLAQDPNLLLALDANAEDANTAEVDAVEAGSLDILLFDSFLFDNRFGDNNDE